MRLELERRYDAEIPTASAQRPEEIVVIICTGGEHLLVGCDHLRRQQIVDGHPVLADQPSNTASEGQTANPRLGHNAARYRQTKNMCFPI